jgi:hypothetical protein
MIGEECRNCRFVYYLTVSAEYQCRRHSPAIFQEVAGERFSRDAAGNETSEKFIRPVTRWPIVDRDDWCGDYQRKGEP